MSIRAKLTLGIMGIVTTIILIIYSIGVWSFLEDKKEDNLKEAYIIKHIIAQDMAKLVFLNSVYSAVEITNKLKYFPHLYSLVLYNLKNQPIYKFQNKIKNKNIVSINTLISYEGKKLGYMKARFYYATLKDILKEYFVYMLGIYILILLLIYIIAYYYALVFTKPIFKLVDFLDSVNLFSLDKTISHNYNNEFGKLYNQTNEMLINLKKSLDMAEKSKKEAAFLQTHDLITGLLNKEEFMEKFKKEALDDKYHLIAIIDIKKFHRINDIYSHKIGDKILFEFANFLRDNFKQAVLAKFGSDDFVVSYINLSKEDIQSISKKIISIITSKKEFKIDNKIIPLSYTIGINVFNHTRIENAIKEADIALNKAKREDKEFVFYEEELGNEVLEKFKLKEEIEKAIKNDEFIPFYQLQYHSSKGVYGAEALVRWRHPKKGILSPFFFLPVAEESEQIIKIGEIMLEKSIAQLAKWQKENKKWQVSVNVHIKQFNMSLVEKIKTLISKYKIDPNYLTIEILENFFLQDSDKNMEVLLELKKLGIKIAIDDFGTGYSSLQYIKNLPIDEIKIDQNFVFDMFENEKNIAIIKSMIFLAKEIKVKVIAEGVESEKHFKTLKELGCELFQGYYFSKPLYIYEFESLTSEIKNKKLFV